MHVKPDFNNGAIPSLRGYRVQFLETLRRVLIASEGEIIYPEFYEDYSVALGENLKEIVQVKHLESPLVLSSLQPRKKDSFIRRCIKLIAHDPKLTFRLVSVGRLGGDLTDFVNGDINSVLRRLVQEYDYDKNEVLSFLNALSVICTTEENIYGEISKLLGETVVGGDVDTALRTMHFWMYLQAEKQKGVTRSDLLKKYSKVGKFLLDRRQYLQQFGRSILPISTMGVVDGGEALMKEYFSGVAARYQHILANLDLRRPDQLKRIDRSFSESNLVLLHGASGQGKSTLAYRYAHDRYPKGYLFEILLEECGSSLLEIKQAIVALAKPYDYPFLLLLDVPPGNEDWMFLVRQLVQIDNCRVLVTIREEDLNRSSSIEEFQKAESIKLELRKTEAEKLFQRLRSREGLSHFLNFTDAWSKFGEVGPFLEFAYLLRSGERLKERLFNQLNRLRLERSDSGVNEKIALLQQVVFAGAHDCRLDLRRLLAANREVDYDLAIQHLKDEYLIRTSRDGQYLEALHPIRARLLMEIMEDPILLPRAKALADTLPYIAEPDLGNYVLQYGYNCVWDDEIQDALVKRTLSSWRVGKEIFRSLIWCGVRDYMQRHEEAFDKLNANFRKARELAMLLHFAPGSDLSTLSSWFPGERLAELREVMAEYEELDSTYEYAFKWLDSCEIRATTNNLNAQEADGLGYVLFWLGRIGQYHTLKQKTIDEISLSATNDVDMESWANLLLGLQNYGEGVDEIVAKMKLSFISHFQKKMNVFSIEETEKDIEIGILIDSTSKQAPDGEKPELEDWHKQVMDALELIRKAIPSKEFYGVQGYGQKIRELELQHDQTRKRLSRATLRPKWETDNYLFLLNLTKWDERPTDWSELIEEVILKQEEIVFMFKKVQTGIKILSKRKRVKNSPNIVPKIDLPSAQLPLPKEAVDKFGFTGDSINRIKKGDLYHTIPMLLQLLPEVPESIKALKNFYTYLQSFVYQAEQSIAIKAATSNWKPGEVVARSKELAESGFSIDNLRLSIYNLEKCCDYVEPYEKAIAYLTQQAGMIIRDENSLVSTLNEFRTQWAQFMNRGLKGRIDLKKVAEKSEDAVLDQIFERLEGSVNELVQFVGAVGAEVIFSDRVEGNWYLLVEVDDWISALEVIENAFNTVTRGFGNLGYGSFARSVCEKSVKAIWVIPYCGDIVFNRQAASFKLYQVVDVGEEDSISLIHVTEPIPDKILADLELTEGKDLRPEIEDVKLLETALRRTMMLAHHLGQLHGLPITGMEGDTVLKKHMRKIFGLIEDCFEQLQISLNAFREILLEEVGKDESWLRDEDVEYSFDCVVSTLQFTFDDDDDTQTILSLFLEWADELYRIEHHINVISIAWMNIVALKLVVAQQK